MRIDPLAFRNLLSVYEIAPNIVEVITTSHRIVRISLLRTSRAGRYWYVSRYFERVDLSLGQPPPLALWRTADCEFSPAGGDTLRGCLWVALGSVDDRANRRADWVVPDELIKLQPQEP
jgi:hypothetical protein